MSTKKRTRGRPRSFDLNHATQVALRLFREKGYDGVGISELSEAIGVNPPSLYAAFGSKRRLFERATRLYAEQEGRFVEDALAQESDPAKGVEKLLMEACHVYVTRPDCRGCLVLEAAKNCSDSEVKGFLRTFRLKTKKALKDYMLPLGRRKAEPLADFVMLLMAGLSSRAKDGAELEALLDSAAIGFRGFLDYLRNT